MPGELSLHITHICGSLVLVMESLIVMHIHSTLLLMTHAQNFSTEF